MSQQARGLPELERAAVRALPAEDPTIDALDTESRAIIAAEWARRTVGELSAGAVFAVLSRGLFAANAPAELLWLTSRAVLDELRHTELCRAAAARYGDGTPPPRPKPLAIDAAPGGVFLQAIANGAINETIASAFLSASLEDATSPYARSVVRELMTDEVDHARIGWAVLALPGPEGDARRRDLAGALGSVVALVRDVWRAAADACPEEVPAGHGCLTRARVHAIVDDAIASLVLPGFEHVGVDASRARRVLRCG